MSHDLFGTPPATASSHQLDTQGLPADTHKVALAGALLWTYFTRTDVYHLLPLLGFKNSAGRNFTNEQVKNACEALKQQQQLQEHPKTPGYFQLDDRLRVTLYRQLLERQGARQLVELVCRVHQFDLRRVWLYSFRGKQSGSIALLRAMFLAGAGLDEIAPLAKVLNEEQNWWQLAAEAVLLPFDGESFERLDPYWQSELANRAVISLSKYWSSGLLPVVDWAWARLQSRPESLASHLRMALADLALQRGDMALLEQALHGIDGAGCDVLRAATLIADGQWASGQQAFEAALKRGQAETGVRKRVFPESVTWFYPLSLLAQGGPKQLELARKFCVGEAGKRTPSAYDDWGRWVNAIDARLGNAPLVPDAFSLQDNGYEPYSLVLFWKVMLAAWIGSEALGAAKAAKKTVLVFDGLRRRLQECGFKRLLAMLDAAEAVLGGDEPPAGFFVAGKGERWREVLGALQALAGDGAAAKGKDDAEKTRILWTLSIGKQGELLDIKPLEQKRGSRGWSTPKALPLGRLAANQALSPADARVARCLRADRYYAKRFNIDLAAAIGALVGHPAVALEKAPGQLVDLVETPPELEAVRQGDKIVMRINPPLRAEDTDSYYLDAEAKRDAEALRLITLLPDGAQRVRLVRYTAAQKRAAQLVSGRFAVPAKAEGAQAELDKTLQALAGHFQVQADAAQASRQVAAESRLRAELAPVGEALSLRLVAAPFGADGPRLPVGSGRVRLMAAIGGETLGAERDLAAERKHLESLLDAFPSLEEIGDPAAGEWLIEDPEQALGLVEGLPAQAGIAAVDWPKGKSVRVISVDAGKLGITVNKERDWFRVAGQAALDEGLVVQLSSLLAAARDKSRFIPIGDGIYVALTRALKQKLLDLAAVAEVDKQGSKVPQIAAAWLDDVLDGTELEAGADFRQAIDRLRAAQNIMPKLPKSLQAELRPYQEEGYQWAMRLAAAGMGGCLADDMGLGKTLQALAVMLERAPGGATLVVAPTSVCGNWLAEALRFAPSLNTRIYSEASDSEREQLIDGAGPQDVLIVSYTLLQLAQERFAGRSWHTVVADEAQAIKNAATKRSQAVFELPADFRLALSGTPVENRLAELWSIMRFANPGLLGSSGRFNERFAGPIERSRDRDAQHVLKRLIGPFVLRRTKAQVLQDLPPRTELILSVAPESAEAAHYEALRRQAIDEVGTLDAQAGQARFNILAQLTRLRRAACDPRLVSPEFGIVGAKVQAFAELAAELTANGHKTLVFSQFVDFLQILRAPLDAAGISYQYLDGATPAAERSKRVAAFQAGDSDLFLISLKAGGFGLNLTAADYVVITDPWWNPAAEDQAMGRAHRIGQLRPVTVYRLVSKGSIEERIVDLHHDKRALADSILDEGDASTLPSTEDLVALIRGE
ncbi:DEAD/DEAH box helicase [Azovibrio restrictus]|uniref:DEAD/DEAH box helicase n=1 Tax=Azovibrio restrictus TaxID=146938 RepID=UPI0026EF7150|nr:DEAD/DEAH box helicase [Azovibrio restrictus]MDD3481774.1 DEAD/DEAH box helicase [Azovibrio restrictus]